MLRSAADELRANLKLTSVQYRDPVLGLVFLAYVEDRSESVRAAVNAGVMNRNLANVIDYRVRPVLYVPDESRLSYLVNLSEGKDVGKVTDVAIRAIEETNLELKGVLPRGSQKPERSTLIGPLRLFVPLPKQFEGDTFEFIYKDFLFNFATQEGRGDGRYFAPYSTRV